MSYVNFILALLMATFTALSSCSLKDVKNFLIDSTNSSSLIISSSMLFWITFEESYDQIGNIYPSDRFCS